MQYERDVHDVTDFSQTLKINFWPMGVKPVRRTNRHGQAVHSRQFHKAFCFLRIGQKCAFGVHAHIVFHTAQTSQLGLDAAVIEMAEFHDGFHQRHVLLKREVAAVDHCAAHARIDLAANVVQRLMVIEMQRQRHVVAEGIRAAQRVNLFQRDMFKGARRPGQNHRRSHFAAHFQDRLDRFGVMNVKRRNRIAFGLRILQKVFR
ncbi:hypothetical protein D3C80_1496790 [compost metagenome]